MNTPSSTIGMAWPAIWRGFPSGVYLPRRGPRNTAPASAAHPPVRCTTVEPAKSLKRAPAMEMSAMNPPPQVQWTTSGYTKALIATLNSRYALNRARSAIAPEAIVTAAAAKTAWKKKNAPVVMLPNPLEPTAARSLPARKKPSVPHQALPPPNARPYPTARKATAPMHMSARFLARMLAVFLTRVRPVSTRAKPACMTNTSTPASTTQALSSAACTTADGSSACAATGVARAARIAPAAPRTINVRRFTSISRSGRRQSANCSH